MGRSSHLVQFFWVASILVQLAIAAAMVRRRLHREFPMFFTYSLFRATSSFVMFFLLLINFYARNLYSTTNWFHETGCIILRFMVVYELFTIVLKPYSLLKDRVGSIFRWGTVALLLAAVLVTINYQWGPDYFFNTLLNFIDRTVDVIQCGLLLLLIMFSGYLRLSWRNYAFGIAVGLGVFAAVDLGTAAVMMERLPRPQEIRVGVLMSLISTAMYFICTLIWLAYALLPEPVRPVAETIPAHDLDSWDHELHRLLQ